VTVAVTQTDAAGNVQTVADATASFTLDTIVLAPVLSLSGPANGATAAEAKAADAIQVTGESGAAIRVVLTGTGGTVTKDVTGTGSAQSVALTDADLTRLGQGTVTVSATQVDAAGNVQTAAASTASFTLDTLVPVAPTLTLTGLANGATAAEATAANAIQVTGESGAAIQVVLSGQSSSVTVDLIGTGSAQSVALTADNLTTLGEGAVTVAVTQTDAAGNAQTAAAASATFTLDTTAPSSLAARTTSLTSATDTGASSSDGVTNIDTPTIVIDLSGQDYVEGDIVILRDGSEITRATISAGDITSGLTQFSLAVPVLKALSSGDHSLTVEVLDAAGNIGVASLARIVTVDKSPPTLTMNAISGADASGFNITGTATGAEGQTVSVTLNGKTYTGVISEGAWSAPVTAADAGALSGEYSLSATVSDLAGNPSDAVTKTLTASVSGIASDGYISGALYFVDTDGDNTLDAGEAFTIGDAVGNYRLPSGPVVMKGGVDISTGMEFTSVYEAAAGYRTITPVTTLVVEIAKLSAGGLVATGEQIANGLLPSSVDLATFNPLIAAAKGTTASDFETALAYQKVAAQLSIFMDVGSTLIGNMKGLAGADAILAQTQTFSTQLMAQLAQNLIAGVNILADAAFIQTALAEVLGVHGSGLDRRRRPPCSHRRRRRSRSQTPRSRTSAQLHRPRQIR
jgi:hypothetical protein